MCIKAMALISTVNLVKIRHQSTLQFIRILSMPETLTFVNSLKLTPTMRISLVLLWAILSTITVSPSSARPSSVRRLGPASWSGLVWCYWALARPPQVQENIFYK